MSEVKKSSKRDHKTKKDTAATTTAPTSSTEPSGDAINEKTRMQVAAMKRFFDQQQVETTEWKESRQRRLAAAKTAAGDAPEQSELIMRKAYERETNLLRSRRKGPMIKSEWVPISRLGSGGFAEVFLCRHRNAQTGELVAVKRLEKNKQQMKNVFHRLKLERDVLVRSHINSCEWLVRCRSSFQDETYCYLVLDYCPGGDFASLLQQFLLKEEHVRFYAAEMLMAIAELHSLGYSHRDLKPENFLIDARGHLRLSDFGLSNALTMGGAQQMLKSRVGSPEFAAVEVVRGDEYSASADWWSLGIIIYEMLHRATPFAGRSVGVVLDNVVRHRKVYKPPRGASPVMCDLLENLICEPEERFTTAAQIRAHPWFVSINFEKLRDLQAPIVPYEASDVDNALSVESDEYEAELSEAERAKMRKDQEETNARLALAQWQQFGASAAASPSPSATAAAAAASPTQPAPSHATGAGELPPPKPLQRGGSMTGPGIAKGDKVVGFTFIDFTSLDHDEVLQAACALEVDAMRSASRKTSVQVPAVGAAK